MHNFLEISIMGSVMVLLVVLIRMVLQNRVRRSTILIFWMIALGRFLIPVTVPSTISIYNLPVFETQVVTTQPPASEITLPHQMAQSNTPLHDGEVILPSQEVTVVLPPQEISAVAPSQQTEAVTPPQKTEAIAPPQEIEVSNPQQMAEGSQAPVSQSQATAVAPIFVEQRISLGDVLTIVWLSGGALVLLFFGINRVRSLLEYRFSLPAKAVPVAVPARVQVRTLDGLTVPLTYGTFRPVILLPPSLLRGDPAHLEHILRHELSHIRHHDVAVKGLMLLAVALHWFNPLVWILFFAASRDMEMRCDEDVVAQLGKGGKLAYAQTLVAIEQRKLTGYLKTGFSFGSTAGRLEAMVKTKPSKILSILAAVCVSLCLIFGFCTSRAIEPAQEDVLDPQQSTVESTEPLPEAAPQKATPFAEGQALPVGKLTTQVQHSKESKAEGNGNFTWCSNVTTNMRVYTTQCLGNPDQALSSSYIGIYNTCIKHSDGTIAPLEETVPELYPGESFTFCVYTIGLPEYQVYSTVPDALEVTYEVIDGTLYGTATAIAPSPATVWIGTSRFNKIMNVADVVVLPPKKTETQSSRGYVGESSSEYIWRINEEHVAKNSQYRDPNSPYSTPWGSMTQPQPSHVPHALSPWEEVKSTWPNPTPYIPGWSPPTNPGPQPAFPGAPTYGFP